jgi:hypothetical protein
MMMGSGRTLAAVAVMLVLAAFQLLEGIRAVVVGGTFVDGSGFAYQANNTAFGWLHIGLGALVALSALALVSGRAWARGMAVGIAILVAVASFFWIPFLPVFAFLLIAFSVFVIWAATTGGRQRMMQGQEEGMGAGYGQGPGYGQGGPGYGDTGHMQSGYGQPQAGERWPSENQPAGRGRWVSDKQPAGETPAQAQERANAEARMSGGRPPNTQPPRGEGG